MPKIINTKRAHWINMNTKWANTYEYKVRPSTNTSKSQFQNVPIEQTQTQLQSMPMPLDTKWGLREGVEPDKFRIVWT